MDETPKRGLDGLRVLSFESRKQSEMRMLIEKHGGLATLAASMREVPLDDHTEALDYARRLVAGEFDVTILMTGVGTRHLVDAVAPTVGREAFLEAMQRTCLIVRGPKPASVLREWKMRFDHHVPEPNTWRDLLAMLDAGVSVAGKRVAVQEYGLSNTRLLAGLRERGATVTAVPVYRWAMPEDRGPLDEAVRGTVEGRFDLLLFTSAQQLNNVLVSAEEQGLRERWLVAANACVIGSIGPTASETLRDQGLPPDFEPEHPKMGHLVLTAAERTRDLMGRE
jgi:uroporphyrinogen-III synthase